MPANIAKPLLEVFPFPFDRPEGRELHLALCEIYASSKAAVFAAVKVGIPEYKLAGAETPYLLWKDILELAAGMVDATRDLVKAALADVPRTPRREFLQALVDKAPVPPLNTDTTKFRKEPEALLYHDDLTLPMGDVAGLIVALEKVQTLAPSVCKIEVSCPGFRGFGTGFRISNDLLLTNWHVLYLEGNAPAGVVATFGYEGTSAGAAFECDPASAQADQTDDWGVVRMKTPPPAATVPIVSLDSAAVPVKDTGAFVIQHPAGDRKRVAYARNRISSFDSEVVHYTSDTRTGSSGAPVFDGDGRLIALHRAGGVPQEIAGQTPIRLNEGARIERVRQGLAKLNIQM